MNNAAKLKDNAVLASLVAVPDCLTEEGGREVRQHNVRAWPPGWRVKCLSPPRAVVGVESRAAEPGLLPGQVLQGGEVPPHPADVVTVE